MKVYGTDVVEKFAKGHAASRKPLKRFLALVAMSEWSSLVELQQSFPSADYAPHSGLLIFNIGGNNYRLMSNVDFTERIMVIRSIMTHGNYSKEKF